MTMHSVPVLSGQVEATAGSIPLGSAAPLGSRISTDDEFYCVVLCPKERREGEDCALVGGCCLAKP